MAEYLYTLTRCPCTWLFKPLNIHIDTCSYKNQDKKDGPTEKNKK